MYELTSITPLDEITTKEKKTIGKTIIEAEKSLFNSSLRLGACLRVKKQCILWGEPT